MEDQKERGDKKQIIYAWLTLPVSIKASMYTLYQYVSQHNNTILYSVVGSEIRKHKPRMFAYIHVAAH